jgi:hypothetical protein
MVIVHSCACMYAIFLFFEQWWLYIQTEMCFRAVCQSVKDKYAENTFVKEEFASFFKRKKWMTL